MNVKLKMLITLLIIFVMIGCSSPTNKTTTVKNTGTEEQTKNFIEKIPPLNGAVSFPKLFSTKATETDIVKNGATVSLIQIETGRTVASGMTDTTGRYIVLFNYRIPLQPSDILGKFLIVEAKKRMPDPASGKITTLRTLVKFKNDYTWESITGTSIHGINTITTAISIMNLRNMITDLNNVLSKVVVSNDDPLSVTSVVPFESITVNDINNLKTSIENILGENKDPIVQLSTGITVTNISAPVNSDTKSTFTLTGTNFANGMTATINTVQAESAAIQNSTTALVSFNRPLATELDLSGILKITQNGQLIEGTNVTVPKQKTGVPTGLSVSNKSQSSFTLSWTAVAGAAEYQVYKDGIAYSTKVTATTKNITGLTAGTIYNMQVTAFNSGGESLMSPGLDVTTDISAPVSPTGLNKSNITQTSFTLSWTAVGNTTDYQVYKDNAAYLVPTTETSMNITGLSAGTTYNMQVTAKNAGGESPKSAVIIVVTNPELPTAPIGLNKANITQTSFTLSWTAVGNATDYQVYKDNAAYLVPTTGTSMNITGLSAGTAYNMQVTAKNAGGESPKSLGLNVTTQLAPPASPTGLSESLVTANSFNVTWNTVSGATGYNVYKDFIKQNFSPISVTNYSFTGLFEGINYSITVTALNAGGESGYSNPRSVTTIVFGKVINWVQKTAMPDPRYDSSFAVYNNELYVFGGDYRKKTKIFNPSSNIWDTTKADIPSNGVTETWGAQVNGKFYMSGNGFDFILRIYDPSSNTWTTGTNWPSNDGKDRYSASAVIGNKIYVIGGGDASLVPTGVVSVYDTSNNTWSTATSLQAPRYGASSVVYNNKIYVFGGYGSTYLNSVEVYNPATNTWSYVSPIPNRRRHGQAVVLNNKIYLMGGLDSSTPINTVDMYNPTTDTWYTATPFTDARWGFAIGVINNKIYITGGLGSGLVSTTYEGSITN